MLLFILPKGGNKGNLLDDIKLEEDDDEDEVVVKVEFDKAAAEDMAAPEATALLAADARAVAAGLAFPGADIGGGAVKDWLVGTIRFGWESRELSSG